MKAIVSTITSVVKPPEAETLTVVTVDVAGETHQVVANLKEDGTPRWSQGEVCIYIPEGATVPQDVLEERGYWETGAKKGLLGGGSKNNRVKGRAFARKKDPETGEVTFEGFASEGLLFKVGSFPTGEPGQNENVVQRGAAAFAIGLGDDVAAFLGIS